MASVMRRLLQLKHVFHNKNVNILQPNASPILGNILRSKTFLSSSKITPHETVQDPKITSEEDDRKAKETFSKINEQIVQRTTGRLFAVVHIAGKQFKITKGDCLIIEGFWPPDIGDKLSLNKVLLVGSEDFTLIGRPLVQSGLVNIAATVIEKAISHTKTHFKKKRRKQYMRINFYRHQRTMLRINAIEFSGQVNKPPDVSSLGPKNVLY